MTKTLARFFGGAVMLGGLGLLSIPANAQTSGGAVTFYLSADTGGGPARQSYPEVIHVYNAGATDATNVTVTFTPPKGLKVDSSCLVDHLPGGVRSYTCLVGTIAPGQSADVVFVISTTKPADVSFTADVTCDQHATASIWLPLVIS